MSRLRGKDSEDSGPILIPAYAGILKETVRTMAFVYIFRSGSENIFKIGKSRDPAKRRNQLSTGNPHKLTELDRIQTDDGQQSCCEKFLQNKLRSKRVIHGEAANSIP